MFKVYSSVPLSTSTFFCNPQHHPSPELFHHPILKFCIDWTITLQSLCPTPPVTIVLPSMCDFDDSGYQTEAESYCIFLCLTGLFHLAYVFNVHLHIGYNMLQHALELRSFLRLNNNIPLHLIIFFPPARRSQFSHQR